jgi:hypothetical protein
LRKRLTISIVPYNVSSSVLQVRRQQGGSGHFEYEDESRGMMIDYSDHQPYREGSATPVLDCDEADEVRTTAKVMGYNFALFDLSRIGK